jgi:hypothetical protein
MCIKLITFLVAEIYILCLQVPIIKERRRFTDVMEENSLSQRENRLEAWGRDDFSVYKMHKVKAGTEDISEISVSLKANKVDCSGERLTCVRKRTGF